MKENREEYELMITKEITERLNLDINKEYSIEEINDLLAKHSLKGGIIQFKPTKPHSAELIIETLVKIDMIISDAINKNMGYYEDKGKCDFCGGYFVEDRMFQIHVDGYAPFICEDCRRKNKLKLSFSDFKQHIKKEEKEAFILQEIKFGIDYSDYIEKINNKKGKVMNHDV